MNSTSHIKARLKKLDDIDVTLLSDEQLERLAGPPDPKRDAFFRSLTDSELETLSKGLPGSATIMRRYYAATE